MQDPGSDVRVDEVPEACQPVHDDEDDGDQGVAPLCHHGGLPQPLLVDSVIFAENIFVVKTIIIKNATTADIHRVPS